MPPSTIIVLAPLGKVGLVPGAVAASGVRLLRAPAAAVFKNVKEFVPGLEVIEIPALPAINCILPNGAATEGRTTVFAVSDKLKTGPALIPCEINVHSAKFRLAPACKLTKTHKF